MLAWYHGLMALVTRGNESLQHAMLAESHRVRLRTGLWASVHAAQRFEQRCGAGRRYVDEYEAWADILALLETATPIQRLPSGAWVWMCAGGERLLVRDEVVVTVLGREEAA